VDVIPLGAVGQVTGSCTLLVHAGSGILVDMGSQQGNVAKAYTHNSSLVHQLARLQVNLRYVLVTHSHIDHSGLLPLLRKRGFHGQVIVSSPTRELLPLMLIDSARIAKQEALWLEKHRRKLDQARRQTGDQDLRGKGKKDKPRHDRQNSKGGGMSEAIYPLYSEQDVEWLTERLVDRPPNEWKPLKGMADDMELKLLPTGHILGSVAFLIRWREGSRKRSILFTGDVGRKKNMILYPRQDFLGLPSDERFPDLVVTESTYGADRHLSFEVSKQEMIEKIRQTHDRDGKVLIAAFSLERTQELLYMLYTLREEGVIPQMPIYLDSPLAIKVSNVYSQLAGYLRELQYPDFLTNGGITQTLDKTESQQLNAKQRVIIMAASGMCDAGRIVHHLANGIDDPRNLVILTGFSVRESRGRKIAMSQKGTRLRIYGQSKIIRADVLTLFGISAHEDGPGMVDFLRQHIDEKNRVMLLHGEAENAQALRRLLIADQSSRFRDIGRRIIVPEEKEDITKIL
jgi:metallo-beta-lactamase family protein